MKNMKEAPLLPEKSINYWYDEPDLITFVYESWIDEECGGGFYERHLSGSPYINAKCHDWPDKPEGMEDEVYYDLIYDTMASDFEWLIEDLETRWGNWAKEICKGGRSGGYIVFAFIGIDNWENLEDAKKLFYEVKARAESYVENFEEYMKERLDEWMECNRELEGV